MAEAATDAGTGAAAGPTGGAEQSPSSENTSGQPDTAPADAGSGQPESGADESGQSQPESGPDTGSGQSQPESGSDTGSGQPDTGSGEPGAGSGEPGAGSARSGTGPTEAGPDQGVGDSRSEPARSHDGAAPHGDPAELERGALAWQQLSADLERRGATMTAVLEGAEPALGSGVAGQQAGRELRRLTEATGNGAHDATRPARLLAGHADRTRTANAEQDRLNAEGEQLAAVPFEVSPDQHAAHRQRLEAVRDRVRQDILGFSGAIAGLDPGSDVRVLNPATPELRRLDHPGPAAGSPAPPAGRDTPSMRGAVDTGHGALSLIEGDLERARKIASDAGLTVVDDVVYQPDPAGPPGTAQDAKSRAYREVHDIVAAARAWERGAAWTFQGQRDHTEDEMLFVSADLAAGLGDAGLGHSTKREARLTEQAARHAAKVAEIDVRGADGRVTHVALPSWARNATHAAEAQRAQAAAQRTAANRARIPAPVQDALTTKWGPTLPKVGKVIPVLGTAIAVVDAAADVSSGESTPAQAIVSNGGGLAAGALSGALSGAIFGSSVPVVGTLVGTLVGTGVGAVTSYVIDNNWDEISNAAEAVGDWFSSLGDGPR